MNRPKGFSLIELLVVIAIIGLLSTMAVVSLNNARTKARDSRRMGDLKAMQTAVEMYKTTVDTDAVPTPSTWALFQTALASQLSTLPVDPTNTSPNIYVYCHFNAPTVLTERGRYLLAAQLEQSNAITSDLDIVSSSTMTCVRSDAGANTAGLNCTDGTGNMLAVAAGTGYVDCIGSY